MSREKPKKNVPTPVPTLWDTIRPAGAADECFADEIAIDFPSVDTMVARVRDSFLGEPADADTLTTEVAVSTREASRGVVLPLSKNKPPIAVTAEPPEHMRAALRLCGWR